MTKANATSLEAVDGRELSSTAARGATFTILGQIVRMAVMFVGTVILARLLTPSDFGLMAIVVSLVAFGELVRDFGLSTAAAREVELSRAQQSNLFWVNSALGGVLTVAAYFSAQTIAAIFRQPDLVGMVESLSLVFVINGFATQFRAELNRRLDFKSLAVVDTAPPVVGLIAAILFIFLGQASYWALVCQQLATAIVGLVLAVIAAKWMPGLPNRKGSIRNLLSFGLGLFGTQSIAYVTRNMDNLMLGYFWGPTVLGIYSRGYQLLMVPINQIAAPLTRVAVPILTRVVTERDRFMSFLMTGQLIGGVGLGVVYGVFFGMASPLVQVAFGSEWSGMVPVVQALAVGGVFRALNQVTFWIFLAKDATGAQFRFYLFSQPFVVASMLAGLPWGAIGVAIGHSIGYGLNWLLSYWWCGRETETDMAPLLRAAVKGILCFTIPVGMISVFIQSLVDGAIVELLLCSVGASLYLILLGFVSSYALETYRTGIRAVRKVVQKT
ncbi:lipopolysaccharide biosynthesis protein [Rhodococcus sp. NPDC003318]|uniref:lipopolysaccharide biosynthesis protein n=1 Tax=Rhodococcus sp. NPDC003318 TaxID=3364503 RepID=UPI00369D73C4